MNEKALLYLYGWIEGTIGERLFSFTDFKLAAAHAEALGIVNNIPAVLRIGGAGAEAENKIDVHINEIQEDILSRVKEASDKVVATLHTQGAPVPLEVGSDAAPPEPVKVATWQPLKRGGYFVVGAKIRLKSDWKEICELNSYGTALENIEYEDTAILGEEYIVESYVDDGSLAAPLQLDLTDEVGNQIDLFWTEYELWEILR